MNEREWVEQIATLLRPKLEREGAFKVETGHKLAYAFEVREYDKQNKTKKHSAADYETDLIIKEMVSDDSWIPRIVIEGKINSVTTHDTITYSHKANTHKTVHPYLRYGIMLGSRDHYPLPGRLFRHGAYFDFMISFRNETPDKQEYRCLLSLLLDEIENSRTLERIIYDSRKRRRDHYTILQKSLILK